MPSLAEMASLVSTKLEHYQATTGDLPLLAKLNQQLIEDEGHRNPMTLTELETRMRNWLESGVYEAWLFKRDGIVVAYALLRPEREYVYLRQFFVSREARRMGNGRLTIQQLRNQILPAHKHLRLEVLVTNHRARAFWTAVGFTEYAVTMEMNSVKRET